MAQKQLSKENVNVAKMALRDRSPDYQNSKLVSQTSLQNEEERHEINN